MTTDEIEDIWDKYVGDPTHRHPLEDNDKHVFARAIIQADRAQRQAVQEPYAWATADSGNMTDFSAHRTDVFNVPLYAAPQPAQVPLTEAQLFEKFMDKSS